jgi:transcriptional regulator with XRE-family HTH domain
MTFLEHLLATHLAEPEPAYTHSTPLATALLYIRHFAGLTREELAIRLGIRPSRINAIEHQAGGSLGPDHLLELARFARQWQRPRTAEYLDRQVSLSMSSPGGKKAGVQ